MVSAAGLPRCMLSCHKAVLDSPLAPHSTVPPSTLSSWKQQRPQSERTSDFYLEHAFVDLQAKIDYIALHCLTHALRVYAMS